MINSYSWNLSAFIKKANKNPNSQLLSLVTSYFINQFVLNYSLVLQNQFTFTNVFMPVYTHQQYPGTFSSTENLSAPRCVRVQSHPANMKCSQLRQPVQLNASIAVTRLYSTLHSSRSPNTTTMFNASRKQQCSSHITSSDRRRWWVISCSHGREPCAEMVPLQDQTWLLCSQPEQVPDVSPHGISSKGICPSDLPSTTQNNCKIITQQFSPTDRKHRIKHPCQH